MGGYAGPRFSLFPLRRRKESQVRPNVLIIITDDQRLDGTMAVLPRTEGWFHTGGELGYGRPVEGGTFFPKAVVTTPLCAPSRASLLTGRYAHNHGTQQNTFKKDEAGTSRKAARGPARFLRQIDSSLPVYLQDAGYRTGVFGRYFPLIDRFDPDLVPHPLPGWHEYALISDIPHAGFDVNENGTRKWIARFSTDYIASQAEKFLDAAKARDDDQPWFLYLAPATPHSPYIAAPRHADASVPPLDTSNPAYFETDRRDKPLWVQTFRADADTTELAWSAYLRMLKSADDLVDRVMRKLYELRETNTIAFYTADHGLMWGEHGLRWKEKPYLESIRVPFFMRWPGHVPSNRTDNRLVANIDIAPTIVDAVNAAGGPRIDPSPPMDGISLLETGPLRTRILTEHFGSGPERRLPRSFFPGNPPSWASIVTDSFQYVEYYRTYPRDPSNPTEQAEGRDAGTAYVTDYAQVVAREYYDLESDPHQVANLLAGDDPANNPSLNELHSLLAEDRDCGAPPKEPCAEPAAGLSPARITPLGKSLKSSREGENPSTKAASEPPNAASANVPSKTEIRPSPTFSPNRTGATFYVGCRPGGVEDPRDMRFEGRLIVGGQPPPPYRPCGAPDPSAPRNFVIKTYDGLESGTAYTFEARSVDLGGNADPNPASYSWQVGPVQTFSSVPDLAAPDVSGNCVQAIVPDGAGGWYVSGDFTAVGGVPRTNLVHIVEDATSGKLVVDTEWAPVTDGAVTTMELFGGTLYVGGTFSSVTGTNGERDRKGLAAFTTTGAVTDWNPQATDASPTPMAATVRALALEPGPAPTSIYGAGDFLRIGGENIEKIAKLDLRSGTSDTSWNPTVNGGTIHALAVTEGHVYVGGGSISSIGGEPRSALAEIERLGRGVVTDWNPAPRGSDAPIVYGLELRRGLGGLHTILVAGRFSSIGSNPKERSGAAEVNLADDGSVTGWNPQLGLASGSGSARATLPFFCGHPGEPIARFAPAAVDPTCSIIVGGEFDTVKIGSQEQATRSGLAETGRSAGDPSDTRTGSANDWDPNLDAAPLAIACWAPSRRCDTDPNRMLAVGGLFTTVGGHSRGRLAFFRTESAERALAAPLRARQDR